MRTVLLSTLLIALAAPLSAQPAEQRRGQEPVAPAPPTPPTPPTPPGAGAAENVQRLTMPLSDPGRPGTLEIDIVMGSITIRGANRRDMQIEARSTANPRPRRRTQDSSFNS